MKQDGLFQTVSFQVTIGTVNSGASVGKQRTLQQPSTSPPPERCERDRKLSRIYQWRWTTIMEEKKTTISPSEVALFNLCTMHGHRFHNTTINLAEDGYKDTTTYNSILTSTGARSPEETRDSGSTAKTCTTDGSRILTRTETGNTTSDQQTTSPSNST